MDRTPDAVAAVKPPGWYQLKRTHITAVAALIIAVLCLLARDQLFNAERSLAKDHPLDAQDAAQLHLPSFAHDDLVLRRGFSLARSMHSNEGWLKVHTRMERSYLSVHAHGELSVTAAEILAVLREVDMIPKWNKFCDHAYLLQVVSPTELWAVAGVRLPWPVPAQVLHVHAKLAGDSKRPHAVVAAARSVSFLRGPDHALIDALAMCASPFLRLANSARPTLTLPVPPAQSVPPPVTLCHTASARGTVTPAQHGSAA
jgi:hypothetical protein